MGTTTFTTRIDADLKARLEKIARNEERSASYLANHAIKMLVEEREATARLATFAVDHLEKLDRYGEDDIAAWLRAPEGTPFPKPMKR